MRRLRQAGPLQRDDIGLLGRLFDAHRLAVHWFEMRHFLLSHGAPPPLADTLAPLRSRVSRTERHHLFSTGGGAPPPPRTNADPSPRISMSSAPGAPPARLARLGPRGGRRRSRHFLC